MRRYGDVYSNPFLRVYYELEILFNPVYHPTWSSLDLVDKVINETTGDILSFTRSKFDDYVVQTTPLYHQELSTTTRSKITSWLNLNFNIGVNYNFVEGGSAGPDNYSGRILRGVQTTAQPRNINVNGQPVSYNLLNWEDGDISNPRIFYASPNESHTATMKGHFISTLANAVSSNSQHKLVRFSVANGETKSFLTYESNGGSFLSISNDDAETWSNEFPIGGMATPTRLYRNASFVPDYLSGTTEILYDKVAMDANTHTLMMDAYDPVTGHINQWTTLATIQAAPGFQPLASAAWTRDYGTTKPTMLAAVWMNANFKYLGLGGYQGGIFSWSANEISGALNSLTNVTNMALAVDVDDLPKPYRNIYIVWEEPGVNGGIKFAHGRYPMAPWPPVVNNTNITWANTPAVVTIAANSASDVNSNPAVAVDGSGNVYISWEYHNATQGNIKIQKRYYNNTGNGDPVYTFANPSGSVNFPHAPSLTDFRNTTSKTNDLILTWYSNNGTQCSQYFDSYHAWSDPYLLDASGRQVNIESSLSPDNTTRNIVYIGATGPLYPIKTMEVPSIPPPQAPVLTPGSTLFQNSYRPTLSWTATGVSYQLYSYTCPNPGPDCYSVENLQLLYEGPATSFTDYSVVIGNKFNNGKVYYCVKAIGQFTQSSLLSNHVSYYENFISRTHHQDDREALPTEITLSANYPNPFNPTTTIYYTLPQEQYVKLVVYNVLGQEVARLVDGVESAGYKTAVFDASNLQSGVYYYRFTAGSFTQMKKMLLLK
jgi:hypothetical protein